MSKCIFSLGLIEKKLLLPLFYQIVYTALFIYWYYFEYTEATLLLEGFSSSLGQIMIFFVSNMYKYRRIKTKTEKAKKSSILDYILLFFCGVLYNGNNFLQLYLEESGQDEENSALLLHINDALGIIFLTVITYFLLKDNYYIHHIISIILFVILSLTIDLILDNYSNINIFSILNSIAYIFVNSFIYSYFKYLIEKKYYFSFDVIFVYGIFRFLVFIIALIIIIPVEKENNNNKLFSQLQNLYDESGVWIIIFICVFGLIVMGFLTGLLEALILDRLSPIFVIIGGELGKIPTNIMAIKDYKMWIILVITILQLIILFFYLEIFEYNFCSLNENTKKNILERERKKAEEINDKEINIRGYDISESIKEQEKEMEEMDGKTPETE